MECLEATLGELKRSSATIEVEGFTVDNAIFRSFDLMVRRQLDPVWHRVGPKTKQLVNDLTTLRSLMNYLLTYDAVTFQSYLETLIASNTTTNSGVLRQNPSPWLGLDAANTIFREAKARVYIGKVDEEEMAKREKRRRRKLERLHRENTRRYELISFITDALKRADVDLGPELVEDSGPGMAADDAFANDEDEEGMGGPGDRIDEIEFDAFFGMLNLENLVVVRVYRGDEDEKALQELRPRFVIMYDADLAFIRRVESWSTISSPPDRPPSPLRQVLVARSPSVPQLISVRSRLLSTSSLIELPPSEDWSPSLPPQVLVDLSPDPRHAVSPA
ncbi:hypothetical protein A4X13_0g8576 [Tilletia indica]|uniref:Uncharacterized protein n=1 Tax=Tilletia indica TaxID=43049 RepID=A0A8T8SE71_9BASI|nr:hypothetical protein A4X13_0g8576 [Tilletia indica]